MEEMIIKLNAPGMTSLHKAGLAGLYMTLRALEEKGETINELKWELEPTQVKLIWLGDKPKSAFEELVARSFWLDEGFIRLTGLEISKPPTVEQKYHLYNALLNCFLQFGPHRSKGNKQILSFEIDEHPIWLKDFEPITWFVHQDVAANFFDKQTRFRQEVEVIGWQYPGCGQRHANVKASDPPQLALALLYAPVGVIFYTIKSKAKGRKARLALLVPEVKDLEMYAAIKQAFVAQGVLDLTASSASDAALRMFIAIEANRASNQFAEIMGESFLCRVITFGIVSWNEKQKTRTYTRSILSGHLPGLENYRKAAAIFKNRWQRVQAKYDRKGNLTAPEWHFVTTFSARELIADNIAQGKVWYHDIASYLSRKETYQQLQYERKELFEMVETASYDDENEHLFIRVCHESWRRRLGKLGARARKENLGEIGFRRLVSKEVEKLRTSLARCKNAEALRETVVDFWARGGAQELLRGNRLNQLLPLFDEKSWKKGRDLALLALISYKPETPEEEGALTATTTDEGEDHE